MSVHEIQIPAPVPRSVKPRHRAYRHFPVVALGREDYLDENGQTGSVMDLIAQLPKSPSTLFCTVGSADFLARLNSVYLLKTPNTWQWRVSTLEREFCRPNDVMRAVRISTVVHYFGWKHGTYHKIIDPIVMYGHSLNTIWPDEVTVVDDTQWRTLRKLLVWGITLRNFCADNDVDVRPTTGGIAAQFLTDKRFYPHPRRKMPTKINERAREELPGNHYYLNVMPDPSNNFTAHYLDQHRAHHYHARTTRLPDSDYSFAYGSFTDLSNVAYDSIEPQFAGLYCLDLSAPKRQIPFDWIDRRHLDRVFVYSNELQHVLDMGYKINGVRAAWGSVRHDEGLRRFACWSDQQLDSYTDAAWLKPLLLSAYGTLATRAREPQAVFRLAKRGEPLMVRTGRRQLNGLLAKGTRKLEPGIVNVLHRGMIEAGCRSESIGLAQQLDWQGHRVLSIYADAVIVEADDDNPLPELPEPWRYKKALNHLQFVNQQAFISDGMTKLPGISRDATRYRQATPGSAPRIVEIATVEALSGRTTTKAVRRI